MVLPHVDLSKCSVSQLTVVARSRRQLLENPLCGQAVAGDAQVPVAAVEQLTCDEIVLLDEPAHGDDRHGESRQDSFGMARVANS